MDDFLKLTLSGEQPSQKSGENQILLWEWIAEGIIQFTPRQSYQKAIVLSAGIHGNETAPIEILNQICTDLITGKLHLKEQVLMILGHPEAMRQGVRYLNNDLNRMFCGGRVHLDEDQETQRAFQLENTVSDFFSHQNHDVDFYHYDLHTAIRASLLPTFALLPLKKVPYNTTLLESLNAAQLDAIVSHNCAGKTFTSYTSEQFNAQSCTLELGKAQPFSHNHLEDFEATNVMLRALLSQTDLCPTENNKTKYFSVIENIIKNNHSFKLNIPTNAPNFTSFSQGEILYSQDKQDYIVENEKIWILFPNPDVKVGLRAGLILKES